MKRKDEVSWTDEDMKYLSDNFGRIHLSEIAEHVERSELAVKCKALRMRLMMPSEVSDNLLITVLELKFVDISYFMPNRKFFEAVGLSQKRYWKIFRGQEKLKDEEYQRICVHLQLAPEDSFNLRQLTLFEE